MPGSCKCSRHFYFSSAVAGNVLTSFWCYHCNACFLVCRCVARCLATYTTSGKVEREELLRALDILQRDVDFIKGKMG